MKLSAPIVLDARLTGEIAERSIAGQIEYWANLGRAIDKLLLGAQALALCRSAAAQPLSACLEMVDSAKGRRQLATHLQAVPFPHYEPAPDQKGFLLRTDADGRRTVGRFVNRKFQPVRTRATRR